MIAWLLLNFFTGLQFLATPQCSLASLQWGVQLQDQATSSSLDRQSYHQNVHLQSNLSLTKDRQKIMSWHSSSIWFCPLFCPLPHLPYILPSFFALALALFFVEGKGKGKKWGQNIGQIWKRAKRRAKLEGKNLNLSEIIYEFLKLQHKSHRIDLNWLYLSNIHLIPTFTFQVWEENARQWNWVEKIRKCASDVLWN